MADTSATLVELAAHTLVPGAQEVDFAFAKPAGLCIGIMQVLRALGPHAARGDLFLPTELLARHGVEPNDVLAARSGAGLLAVLVELRMRAASHYAAAKQLIGKAPPAATPAWLPAALVEPLTRREVEILRLIAAGMRNQEIAEQLFISLSTVKRHVANAYGKLGASHRTEAVARANALDLL